MTRLAILGLALTGAVHAQTVISGDIVTSTTLTPAGNPYDLVGQVYVKNMATLTIQAGVIFRTTASPNGSGSLAVTRGSQIIAQGTPSNPIIFTTSGETGSWREACAEWGNLTIMGRGYVSSCEPGASATCSSANVNPMEGLVPAFPNDPDTLYGGGDDDDDSGTLAYVSLRYGGRVVGLANELNGLSLGAVGRGTDIHHIDIMNNVDDGIEIWGGTVNLKYFSIWNVGDDSLDVDQGWRGKAQFGLIVQGWSCNANQGSGVGDNAIEMDGAEFSDHQPVTTAVCENLTVIGQPRDGDRLTAWRDNARVQFHRCVFMDGAEELVGFDDRDGDPCGTGYGFNGTLGWTQTWSTSFTQTSTVNACPNPGQRYTAQSSGNLAEILDSVVYNVANLSGANSVGVFNAGNNNILATSLPIRQITRDNQVVRGNNKVMEFVRFLDPRPANDAVEAAAFAANDGFFCSVKFRGAFVPGVGSTLGALWTNWTAAAQYRLIATSPFEDLGESFTGGSGAPELAGEGPLTGGSQTHITVSNFVANGTGVLVISPLRLDVPLFGGNLVPSPVGALLVQLNANASGNASLSFPWPSGIRPRRTLYLQWVGFDPSAAQSFSFSNALLATTP